MLPSEMTSLPLVLGVSVDVMMTEDVCCHWPKLSSPAFPTDA